MLIGEIKEEKLNHYTTFDGLEGILQENSLWMTHNSCLNDISEGKYGIEKIIKNLIKDEKDPELVEILGKFHQGLINEVHSVGTCIVSFCKQSNSLNQWRAYSYNGNGVMIGIDSNYLKNLCNLSELRYLLSDCKYKDSEYHDKFSQVYNLFKGNESIVKDFNLLAIIFIIASSFCKHEGFEEEKECRIIAAPKLELSYRKDKGRIMPYHKLALSSNKEDYSWLKEVIIGPCDQQISLKKATETLLREFNIKVKVQISDIPYRALRYYE